VDQRATRNVRRGWLILSIGTVLAISPLATTAALGAAPNCQAPPGTSGIDQYCETIPGSTGNHGPSGHAGSGSSSIDPSTRRALSNQGKAGQAILDLTSAGGTTSRSKKSSGSNHTAATPGGSTSGKSDNGATPPATSNNPLSAVGSAVGSGASAGPAFVWLLVVLGIGLSAVAWMGYRRRGRTQ
jgi:hypothetical protein